MTTSSGLTSISLNVMRWRQQRLQPPGLGVFRVNCPGIFNCLPGLEGAHMANLKKLHSLSVSYRGRLVMTSHSSSSAVSSSSTAFACLTLARK